MDNAIPGNEPLGTDSIFAKLGAKEQQYSYDRDEWARDCLAYCMVFAFAVLTLVVSISTIVFGGSPDLVSMSVGCVLAVVTAYLFHLSRPRLMSLAIHKNGIHMIERDAETILPWSDITRIEECELRSRRGSVPQVVIETADARVFIVMGTMLACYDEFLTCFRQKVAMQSITWEIIA